jgi:2-polyprenyl-6-methoxyphenol hydroxylase-like FAD-dependent oxidoreductase
VAQVMIVGAGPTGLMLACDLRRAGVSVQLVDRAHRRLVASRGAALHPRTMELFDQRDIVDEFLAAGRPISVAHFAGINVDWSTLPTRFPYLFGVLQSVTEDILERCAHRLDVGVQWSTEVTGLQPDSEGVTVAVRGPGGLVQERVEYVVGCDGARSAIRRLAGIAFDGADGRLVTVLGDVELENPPENWLMCDRRQTGTLSVMPLGGLSGQSWWRVMVTEYEPDLPSERITLNKLRESTIRVAGTDFGMHMPLWLSSFTDAHRHAGQYRSGRVLGAGDAAHIHPPMGAQGMNLGLADVVNLSWKLAAVVRGQSSDALLDTYHQERHPQAARVLANTRAQAALLGPGEDVTAMRGQLASLLEDHGSNEQLAAAMSGMDVCYAADGSHPLIGRRMPDGEVITSAGRVPLFGLLRAQRAMLLDFEGRSDRAEAPSATVDYVAAQTTVRQWRLPVVGWVDVPRALLVRPDGYVSWVSSTSSSPGLSDALDELDGSRSAVI